MQVVYHINSTCPVGCPFCPYQKGELLSPAQHLEHIGEHLADSEVERITLEGGDIAQYPHLPELCAQIAARRSQPHIYIYSPLQSDTAVDALPQEVQGIIVPIIPLSPGQKEAYRIYYELKPVLQRAARLVQAGKEIIPVIYLLHPQADYLLKTIGVLVRHLAPANIYLRLFNIDDNGTYSFPYQELADQLQAAATYADKYNLKITFQGDEYPPPCVWDSSVYSQIAPLYQRVRRISAPESNEALPQCRNCDLSNTCSWNYARYRRYFPTDHFSPIHLEKKPLKNIAEYQPAHAGHVQDYQWYVERSQLDVQCLRPWTSMEVMGITENPMLATCCNQDWQKIPQGKLSESSFAATWNGKYYQRVRQALAEGKREHVCFEHCAINIKQGQEKHPSPQILLQGKGDAFLINQIINHHEIADKAIRLRSHPSKFAFGPTSACNYRCIMCHELPMRKYTSATTIRADFYDELTKILPTLDELAISGPGEPLLSKEFITFLTTTEWERYPDIHITLTTNASLLTPALAKTLHAVPFKAIKVSLNAATPHTYQHITGKNWFDKVIDNIKSLQMTQSDFHYQPLLQLSLILMRCNYKELPEFIALCKQLDASLFVLPMEINEMNPAAHEHSLIAEKSELDHALHLLDTLIEKHGHDKRVTQHLQACRLTLAQQMLHYSTTPTTNWVTTLKQKCFWALPVYNRIKSIITFKAPQ